jgi:hypothetical protein
MAGPPLYGWAPTSVSGLATSRPVMLSLSKQQAPCRALSSSRVPRARLPDACFDRLSMTGSHVFIHPRMKASPDPLALPVVGDGSAGNSLRRLASVRKPNDHSIPPIGEPPPPGHR